MIKIRNLSKSFNINNKNNKNYKTEQVLKNINIDFKQNEHVAIIGPSGSGKSTFLRCLNLLETPSTGSIIFNNQEITNYKNNKNFDINKIRRNIGMVFQNFNLFPHLNIIKNITLAPVSLKIMSQQEANIKALELLKKVGLENKKDLYPNSLSGGQKQRVAIVRSLIMNPKLMLFDEPTSALDPEMVKEVVSVIKDIANNNMTMILVTHEISIVNQIATRVLFMDEGEIIEDNTPAAIFGISQNERVNKFLDKLK